MVEKHHSPLRSVIELLALAAALWSAACGGDVEVGHLLEPTRVDSAGAEIVSNQTPATAVGIFAALDSVPTLRLGSLDGRPEEQFGSVTDIEALPDGGVAVLDEQAAEVRVFDSDGAYRTTWGSKGSGPGELQSPSALALLPGDTLAVFDGRAQRITRFGPERMLGRVTTLQLEGPRIRTAEFLPDGGLLGQSIWLSPERAAASPVGLDAPALVRDTAVLTRFSRDGALRDTVDVLPGTQYIQRILMGEGMVSVYKRPPVFGRASVFAVHPDGIWSATNDRFELRLFDAHTGRLVRMIRAPGLERPATDELASAIHDQALAEAETVVERRYVETWYELSPRPETLPAYDRIVVDDNGRLWVRAWSAPDEPSRWWVFEADGALLGAVDVPAGTAIMSVRCGWAWGVEQDDLDVSYVVRYAIRGADGARMGRCHDDDNLPA